MLSAGGTYNIAAGCVSRSSSPNMPPVLMPSKLRFLAVSKRHSLRGPMVRDVGGDKGSIGASHSRAGVSMVILRDSL